MEEDEGREFGLEAALSDWGPSLAADPALALTSTTSGTAAAAAADTRADVEGQLTNGTIRTLDGDLAGDEMEQDALNYQILLGKIDKLLERLSLDG